MKIVYISTSCSEKMYSWVYKKRYVKAIEPQQKFNQLLINGLAEQKDVEVFCISALPLSASTSDIDYFEGKVEVINTHLTYDYIPFKNGKFSRYISLINNTYSHLKKFIRENLNDEIVIITDVLSVFMTLRIFKIAKKYNIPTVGIVTDLPMLATNMKQVKQNPVKKLLEYISQKINTDALSKYDAYIPLTKSIYDAIEQQSKPYLVIEGSINSSQSYVGKDLKNHRRILVYAGGLYEKYGVGTLAEACALLSNRFDFEMHFYGNGNYVSVLEEMHKKNPSIVYKGMASLDEIVRIEQKCDLLINPRPSNEEFSKYSFPSKTLEYMTSGTPILTTKLPGIPKEYFDYCFTIQQEDVQGVMDALTEILSMSQDELIEKGLSAYKFVLENKSNIIQGRKIIDFVESL